MNIEKKTIYKDEELLRTPSKDVCFNNTKYTRYIKLLKKFCNNAGCTAVSGVQIGVPERIIYANLDKGMVLINPTIESAKGEASLWEDNISCGDNIGLVKRPFEILVKFFNEDLDEYIEIFQGEHAAILCQQIDLTNGILFTDIAEEVQNQPEKRRAIIKNNNPYQIISQTSDCIVNKNFIRIKK